MEIEQLVHFGPEEMASLDALVGKLAKEGKGPSDEDIKLLRKKQSAVDIAMFGRMLADDPQYNIEAATQVAHAITVHEIAVEEDFFTAVDDLNIGKEDMGAAHMGETEFAAGLFYLYICVNRDLLIENLSGDKDLSKNALEALVNAAAMTAPTGKQSSFASRAYASYLLAERGNQQPRSLSVAFLKPVTGNDMLADAIEFLETMRDKIEKVYGPCSDAHHIMNVLKGQGSLKEVIGFVRG